MHKMKTKKDFSSMKEYKEGTAAWLADHGFSIYVNWHGKEHERCNNTVHGTWNTVCHGVYLAADYQHRAFVTHRCTKCGTAVQFTRFCDENEQTHGDTMRLVVEGRGKK